MLVLTTCGAALAKKFVVMPRDGWVEPVSLYTAVALVPGSRKTAVHSEVIAPMEEYESHLTVEARAGIADAESRRQILEAQLQKTKNELTRVTGDNQLLREAEYLELSKRLAEHVIPVEPRLLADDVSPERLATLLRDHGGRIAVMSAEGGIFEMMGGRYSSGTPNLDVYLKARSGDTIRVDRVGRPAEHIPKPAMTIGLAVQPDVLRGLANRPGFKGRGLLGRFLYAKPRSLLGNRQIGAPPVPAPIQDTYRVALLCLLRMEPGTDLGGNLAPHILRFGAAARAVIEQFERDLEPRLGEDGDLGHMTDWAGKLAGAVVRIAGILHMAEHASKSESWSYEISQETVSRALAFAPYLIDHAHATFADMGADPVVEDAKTLLRWIDRHQLREFTQRDAHQDHRSRFASVTKLQPAISLLLVHNYIREVPGEKPMTGRPPGPKFYVNPLMGSQKPQNTQNPS